MARRKGRSQRSRNRQYRLRQAGRVAVGVGKIGIGVGLTYLGARNISRASGYFGTPVGGYASRFAKHAAYRVGMTGARGLMGLGLMRSGARTIGHGVGYVKGGVRHAASARKIRRGRGGSQKGHPFYGNQYVKKGGYSRRSRSRRGRRG